MDALLSLLILVELWVNVGISALWAVGATVVAARTTGPPFRWPVPWRWLVAFWMSGKTWLFAETLPDVVAAHPGWDLKAALFAFTIGHSWAFWRWLHLPDAPEGREATGPQR